MKKLIYVLLLPLVVVGGLVFANREINKKPIAKRLPLTAAEMKAARKQWEVSPDQVKCTKNGRRLRQVKKCMPVRLKL